MTFWCHGAKGNQEWQYDPLTGVVYHPATKKCLSMTNSDKSEITLSMEPCDDSKSQQKWKLQNYKSTVKEFQKMILAFRQ